MFLVGTGKIKESFKAFCTLYDIKEIIITSVVKVIQSEMAVFCSNLKGQSFKVSEVTDAVNFSFGRQSKELQEQAPCTHTVLHAIGINPGNKRCKKKTNETCTPAMMTVAWESKLYRF